MNNEFLGSSVDDFMREEGIYEHCHAVAVKRVLSYQLLEYMTENHITKTDMATRLKTSRMGLNRLLNADNTSITLDTMMRAANVVGKKISISLVA
jgi:predicted XRE-type DNA-binding protein